MSKSLLIKLHSLEIRNKNHYEYAYFSFSITETLYFSSCFDEGSTALIDDILIPLPDQQPTHLSLQRWENHMIMFTHLIDISELKSRQSTKKMYETKAGQILSFTILVLKPEQLIYNSKYIKTISQHYLIVSNIKLNNERKEKKTKGGPSFFVVKTSQTDAVVPVTDGSFCIKLPQTIEIEQIKSGVSLGKTDLFQSDELSNENPSFDLKVNGKKKNTVSMDLKWVTNFHEIKPENALLLEAHEILIYDMEVKFDNANEHGSCKVKFAYGNKAFQVGSEFNNTKVSKIKKIIYFIIKSSQEEIKIIVQKNGKVISEGSFFTGDMNSYSVSSFKKKFIDMNGKAIGQIKFRTEKAKNLSTPLNNKFWKENIKKKTLNSAILSIQQVSVNYPKQESDLSVVVKTEGEEWVIPDVPNFQFFNIYKEISSEGLVISAKHEQSIYMMVKEIDGLSEKNSNQSDFIGIAIINTSELRMGTNSIQIPCFKNQEKTVAINCIINKVIPYPFIKSTFQPQFYSSRKHNLINVQLKLKSVTFTPYYYTYRYDMKNQVYCIVELNNIKKVLIMENSLQSQLHFTSSASSDNLNFPIENKEFIKVKIVCLISDIGQEEEIYGTLVLKVKTSDMNQNPSLQFNHIELKNEFETGVGYFDIELMIKDGEIGTPETGELLSFRKGKKTLQSRQSMEYSINRSINRSINPIRKSKNHSLDLKSLLNKSNRYDKNETHHHESVKLPAIKESKKSELKDLVQLMKVRKRGMKGYDEINTVEEYKSPINEKLSKREVGLHKIEKENPNLERNLELLFPKKVETKSRIEEKRIKAQQYEQKLKGLKSVYNEISQDIVEFNPTSKDSRQVENVDFNGAEWEGNEFAQLDH